MLEPCTPLEHYDYFSGSEVSFALTFLVAALCIPGILFLFAHVFKCKSAMRQLNIRELLPHINVLLTSAHVNKFRCNK